MTFRDLTYTPESITTNYILVLYCLLYAPQFPFNKILIFLSLFTIVPNWQRYDSCHPHYHLSPKTFTAEHRPPLRSPHPMTSLNHDYQGGQTTLQGPYSSSVFSLRFYEQLLRIFYWLNLDVTPLSISLKTQA